MLLAVIGYNFIFSNQRIEIIIMKKLLPVFILAMCFGVFAQENKPETIDVSGKAEVIVAPDNSANTFVTSGIFSGSESVANFAPGVIKVEASVKVSFLLN